MTEYRVECEKCTVRGVGGEQETFSNRKFRYLVSTFTLKIVCKTRVEEWLKGSTEEDYTLTSYVVYSIYYENN